MSTKADDIRSEFEKQFECDVDIKCNAENIDDCCGCAEYDRQLAEWLKTKLQEQKQKYEKEIKELNDRIVVLKRLGGEHNKERQKYASRERGINAFGKYLDTKDECFGCIFAKDDLLGCLNNDQCKIEIVHEIKKEYNKALKSIKANKEG